MLPAGDVGGDYYDVLPCANGAWVGIGDVAATASPLGSMMMIQSIVSALASSAPMHLPWRSSASSTRRLREHPGALDQTST